MIIIEKPYASEFFIDSIVKNNWFVLENEAMAIGEIEEGAFQSISSQKAAEYFKNVKNPLIYSNSENAIKWVLDNLPDSELSRYIRLFKDKVVFRNMLKEIYPDFYYRECELRALSEIPVEELKFPLILKPSVGFLSLGVHTINNQEEWNTVLDKIDLEMIKAEALYPKAVISSSKFIIEEYIQGEEFAIDVYYDREGHPIILNIFQHPFLNSNDVRDRIYMTSAGIMIKYMSRFAMLLKEIGDRNNIRNFPMHIELRVTEEEQIIPIEVNPMRFAGWCTTDVAKYAWGINVYECFMNQERPDWNSILEKAPKGVYYFSMAEVPSDVNRDKVRAFDYEGYLSNFSNVLELRRINHKKNPLFAIIFGSTDDKEEIKEILQLNTKDYSELS